MRKKPTKRDIRIAELMKRSKKDLAILLTDTEFSVKVLGAPNRAKARKMWNDYIRENS